jgi:hypothetical protein
MKNNSVYAIASSTEQANQIVDRLIGAGFPSDSISALFPDMDTTKDFAHEKHTKAPEGAVVGASAGGVIGGSVGLLAGLGALAIPGIGPFIAAGPLMAALSGIAVGATVGGVAGALIGMGVPELEAKRYEGKLKEGNILISAFANSSDQTKEAKRIFEEGGADDICVTSVESVPDERDHAEHTRRSETDSTVHPVRSDDIVSGTPSPNRERSIP